MAGHISLTTRPRSIVAILIVSTALGACSKPAPKPSGKTFKTPEAAVLELRQATVQGDLPALIAIFGPDAQDLVDTSDPETARRNRQVVAVALNEEWHLSDEGSGKVLIVGHENWPFPVPLVKDGDGWRFDTAGGKEEVLARRIGRNELAVIRICRTYVAAQRLYASAGHDSHPAGLFAVAFRSDAGQQNGLYWPTKTGQPRSPLGDLLQGAEQRAAESGGAPAPFHGYYFRILTGQGASASGGAKDYVVNGRMTGGFALLAWPAHYDASGVMTFMVNQDDIVYQKDLGPETETVVKGLRLYDPDASWSKVE
jgi:hypothetical protein